MVLGNSRLGGSHRLIGTQSERWLLLDYENVESGATNDVVYPSPLVWKTCRARSLDPFPRLVATPH